MNTTHQILKPVLELSHEDTADIREIDHRNSIFFNRVLEKLNIHKLSVKGLEWFVTEHYQFSLRNVSFLATAARTTQKFMSPLVSEELIRNFNEENGHAEMYNSGLAKIGCDTAKRITFVPTERFFGIIQKNILEDESITLGVMYATETAAIFEHQVFRIVCNELAERKNQIKEGAALKNFHDMHLNGVERSHKDGLGQFINAAAQINQQKVLKYSGIYNIGIDNKKVKMGAYLAIESMEEWWSSLLLQAKQVN